MDRLQEALSQCGRLVIDGSMSTALEHLGCKLNDRLWTARVLAEHPEMVKEVHLQCQSRVEITEKERGGNPSKDMN